MTPYDLNLQPTVKHLHLTKKHIELVLKCSRSRAKIHNISQVLDLKSNFSQSQRKTELTCGLSHSGSTRHSPQNTAASSSWPPEWVLPPDASCCPENEKPQASPPRATSSSSASRKSPRRAMEDGWRVHHLWVTDWLTACKHLCCSVKKCRLFGCHTLLFPPPPPSSERVCVWERVRLLPGATCCSLHPLPQGEHTTVNVSSIPQSVWSRHAISHHVVTHSHPQEGKHRFDF